MNMMKRAMAIFLVWMMVLGVAMAEQDILSEDFLQTVYEDAYAKEASELDAYLENYIAKFNPDEFRRNQYRSMTDPIRELASTSYDFVMENYPEVAEDYANRLGSNFGGLSYLVSDVSYQMMTDPEAGQVFGELLGSAMQLILEVNYAASQSAKTVDPERAVISQTGQRFTLLRSRGTLWEVVDQYNDDGEQLQICMLGLEERKALLTETQKRY